MAQAAAQHVTPSSPTCRSITPERAAFALFTALALWLAGDRPDRAVWTFSVIAVSFLALWTILLTALIPVRTVLVSVSYILLLAGTAAHASSGAGIFVILLDAGYAAGLFGYALADYRQRRGMERAAENVPRRSSPEEQKEDSRVYVIAFFYGCVGSLVCAGGAALAVYYIVDDVCQLVVVLSLLIDLSLFWWICLVSGHLLRDALVAFDKMFFVYWAVSCVWRSGAAASPRRRRPLLPPDPSATRLPQGHSRLLLPMDPAAARLPQGRHDFFFLQIWRQRGSATTSPPRGSKQILRWRGFRATWRGPARRRSWREALLQPAGQEHRQAGGHHELQFVLLSVCRSSRVIEMMWSSATTPASH